jgi:hypothetical protein
MGQLRVTISVAKLAREFGRGGSSHLCSLERFNRALAPHHHRKKSSVDLFA